MQAHMASAANRVIAAQPQLHKTIKATLTEWAKAEHKGGNIDTHEWEEILARIRPPPKKAQNPKIATASWVADKSSRFKRGTRPGQGHKLLSWNANGFRKRWKDGDVQRLIQEEQPDTLHVSEMRTSVYDMDDPVEVRAFMEGHGYLYCYFSWCNDPTVTNGTGYAGSALFCKEQPRSIRFGPWDKKGLGREPTDDTILAVGGHNMQGRFIAADFGWLHFIGTYSPNSKGAARADDTAESV